MGLLLLCALGCLDNDAGKCGECDDVGDNHEVVEDVGQLPDEVIFRDGAEEDECNGKNRVDDNCDLLGLFGLAEQEEDVLLTEEVPADDGCECEECETYCNKNVTAKNKEKNFFHILSFLLY